MLSSCSDVAVPSCVSICWCILDDRVALPAVRPPATISTIRYRAENNSTQQRTRIVGGNNDTGDRSAKRNERNTLQRTLSESAMACSGASSTPPPPPPPAQPSQSQVQRNSSRRRSSVCHCEDNGRHSGWRRCEGRVDTLAGRDTTAAAAAAQRLRPRLHAAAAGTVWRAAMAAAAMQRPR